MPYLFFKYERVGNSLTAPLARYLSLSGVNLRENDSLRPDAVGLVLTRGAPLVRFRPAGTRFARCLVTFVRSVYPNTALRQDGSLPSFSVPTVFVSLPDSLDDDVCARILANAVQHYFTLPALPDLPEIPARIGERTAFLHTVADERSRVLQVLSSDAAVTLLGIGGKWSVIRASDELGFCRTEDLRLS